MIVLELPLLAATAAVPLLGAVLVRRLNHRDRARAFALTVAGAALVLACIAAWHVYARAEHGLVADPGKLAIFGAAHPLLGIDGLSAALIVLDAVATFTILLAAPRSQLDPRAASSILAVESMTLLGFCALDSWLLWLAVVLALVPAHREVRRAAQPGDTRVVSRVFAVYLFGGAAMLAVGIGLVTAMMVASGAATPMHLPALAQATLPHALAWPAVIVLVIAVAMRAGLFPFHGWVPALCERVPPLVLLPTLLSQMGAYLLIRLVLVAFPGMLHAATPSAADLALVTALYGAFLGLAQRELRRAVGWLVVSQSALVIVGLECDNIEGVAGGLVLWLAGGLAMTGLILSVAAVHARVGPRTLRSFTGLAASAPRLAALFLVFGLANVWLPGTLGFIGEDLLVRGVLEAYPSVGIVIIVASALNGLTVLRAFTYVFLGPPAPGVAAVGQLLPRERLALVGLVLVIVAGGVVPSAIVALRGPAAERIVERSTAAR